MTVPDAQGHRMRGPGRHRYRRPSKADVIARKNAFQRSMLGSSGQRPARPFPGAGSVAAQALAASPAQDAARTTAHAHGRRAAQPLEDLAHSQALTPVAEAKVSPTATGQIPLTNAGLHARGTNTQASTRKEGSLREASKWTILGALLPGLGFLPTRFTRIGIALLSLIGLLTVGLIIAAVTLDPLQTFIALATKRWFLITALVTLVVVAIGWISVIAFTNLEHNRQQRLGQAARTASTGLAYTLAIMIALPALHIGNSLWAGQSLVGNDQVFSGGNASVAPGPDPWRNVERVNILLLGQDAGADRTGTRPDTIMVASIDAATGRTALFSIPRNLQWVRFPEGSAPARVFPNGFDHYGRNQNLINAVWTWAEEVRPDLFPGDEHPGRTATTMAVEETLGLQIDYYAQVNLQGFQDLVNAIGGVEIEVERDIPIGGGNSPVEGYVEQGWQKLDGYQALWYARSREGSSDFDRICRQQRMVRTVTEEANAATIVLAAPRLLQATERNIETDIPAARLDAFTELGLRVQRGGFQSYPIDPSVTNPGDPDYDFLKEWTQASIADSMKHVKPESVRGADLEAHTGTPSAPATSDAPAPTPSESPSAGDDASAPAEASQAPSETSSVEVNPDPLAACMPGNTDPFD